MAGSERLPRWDLSSVYPGLGSPGHAAAKARLSALSAEFLAHLGAVPAAGAPRAAFADWLAEALRLEEAAGSLAETLGSFAYASYSTATRDAQAMAELNAAAELSLPLKRASVLFREALAARRAEVETLCAGPEADPRIAPLAFHLREELFRRSKQMAPELEDLAEDLSRSGGDAWSRLQETVSANASVVWDALTGERKTVVELRNLARGIHPAILTDRGLDAALSALAARSPVPVEISVDVGERPPVAVESTAYFVVAEALTNAAKHAAATRLRVRVWRTEGSVVVEVEDDGVGGAQIEPGGGLEGLTTRVATIDGTLTVSSRRAGLRS